MPVGCPDNIVLIGMPGAGKSSVGVLLAKRLGYRFVDTDLLIQVDAGRRLQEIIARDGLERFKRLEEQTICRLEARRTVIATGGSVVYGAAAMTHLRRIGRLVWLELPLAELQRRVRNMDSRGLVIDPGESFAALFARRQPLYRQYADVTIAGEGLSPDEVAAAIKARLCTTAA
jgi:shikimate kinase